MLNLQILLLTVTAVLQNRNSIQLADQCSDDDVIAYEYERLEKDWHLKPFNKGMNATVQLGTHAIMLLSPKESTLLLDAYLTVQWVDVRLKLDIAKTCVEKWRVPVEFAEKLWKPKLNFHGLQEAKVMDLPYKNEYMWADKNGWVQYQHKMRFRIPCHINLDRFPFDVAKCFIVFSAIEYDDNKLQLYWQEPQSQAIYTLLNKNTEEHILRHHIASYNKLVR